jgi:(p)ppGpp synthase/HD superfamily hydrolase
VDSPLEDGLREKGFPWILRKEDRELWGEMMKEARQYDAEAMEQSGKPLSTDLVFIALILAQAAGES